MSTKPQIIIIGPYPLPLGGISVHVERLASLFKSRGYSVTVFDDYLMPRPVIAARIVAAVKNIFNNSPAGPVIKKHYSGSDIHEVKNMLILAMHLAFRERGIKKIVSYHTKNWKFRAYLCMAGMLNKNLKIVFTVHSLRDEYASMGILNKLFVRFSLKACAGVIATSEAIKNKLAGWVLNGKKIQVMPAFLPPSSGGKDLIPEEVLEFLERHDPVITANASHIRFFNGDDLYGIDMCIDLCARLKKKMPRLGIVFGLPVIDDKNYYSELKKLIKLKNIQKNFLFIEKPCAFYPLIKESDIFVRPTNTDGDAVSVRESIYLKVPVVASDAAERPEGTVIFRSRDRDDFANKVENIIDNYNSYKSVYNNKNQNYETDLTLKIFEEI